MPLADQMIADFIANVVTEIKSCNNTAEASDGLGNYFGTSGHERIYGVVPSHLQADGERKYPNIEKPTIFVSWLSKDGNIRQTTSAQCGASHWYIAYLEAAITIVWTGSKDQTIENARKYASTLNKWLEEHNANGYCNYVQCSRIVPLVPEKAMASAGMAGVTFAYSGERDVVRTLQYT